MFAVNVLVDKVLRKQFSLPSESISVKHLKLRALQWRLVACLLACLTSQQHASVSQGQVRSDIYTCCHTERDVADQAISQSQHTDIGPTSPSADTVTPGAWQGSHCPECHFLNHWCDSTRLHPRGESGNRTYLEVDALSGRLKHKANEAYSYEDCDLCGLLW